MHDFRFRTEELENTNLKAADEVEDAVCSLVICFKLVSTRSASFRRRFLTSFCADLRFGVAMMLTAGEKLVQLLSQDPARAFNVCVELARLKP